MEKINCWDYKNCGRIPGGSKVDELGVCPSYSELRTNGVNDGKNGGRACWVISGTYCGGQVQGVYASKLANCMSCDFYKQVMDDQGREWQGARKIMELLK